MSATNRPDEVSAIMGDERRKQQKAEESKTALLSRTHETALLRGLSVATYVRAREDD